MFVRVGRPAIAVIVACIVVAFSAGSAAAAPGDLTYQGCITGQTESGSAGSGACDEIANATSSGTGSGLNWVESVTVSPDGRSLYAALGQTAHGVARFDRDPATGTLTYQGCFTGDLSITACTPTPDATADGDNSGLEAIESVAVSPDGESVYLTSRFDDAVVSFIRNTTTGALTYEDCVTGDTAVTACTQAPGATPGGDASGFDDMKIKSVAISEDGRSVYSASEFDDSIVTFSRDTTTGELTYESCLTGDSDVSPPCADISTATAGGATSGLDQPRWLTLGPGDEDLYVANYADDSFTHFTRDATTGELTFADCVSGSQQTTSCVQPDVATADGNDSGFEIPRAIAVSPDGRSAYGIGSQDAAIIRFSRDTTTGELGFVECLTGAKNGPGSDGTGACSDLPTATASMSGPGSGSGFEGMRSLAISADGVSVYVSAQFDSALGNLDRDPATGAVSFHNCVTGDTNVGCDQIPSATSGGMASGMFDLETVALAPDGKSLYGGAEQGDAVSTFAREPAPEPPAPPPGPPSAETGSCQGATLTKTDGTEGDDVLAGSPAADLIAGLGGADKISAAGGSDCASGDGGKDRVKGGAGKDKLTGDAGRDRLGGGAGKDKLVGGGGKDRLGGGGGKDKLKGGAGADRIKAAGGKRDRINCGGGKDRVRADENDRVSSNCERLKIAG